jgi:hypothetical protein
MDQRTTIAPTPVAFACVASWTNDWLATTTAAYRFMIQHFAGYLRSGAAPELSGLARWSAAALPSTGPFPLHFSHDRTAGRYRCHSIGPCDPVGHKYRVRAITIDQGTEDTITSNDLAEYIDGHKDESPHCSLKRPRPNEFKAEHRETIGLHPPGQPFVKPARHPLIFTGVHRGGMPWRRPWGELTTRATYRPDRQTYATLQRDDQAVIDEIDAAIESLLKTGACSALIIARAAAAEILGHHPITNIENRDIRFDAYAHMAGWKRYLPGLKDHDHPIADALQVSFWILALDAETSTRAETAEEKRRRKCEQFLQRERALSSFEVEHLFARDSIMVTSDAGRELLRDLHPDRELLQRLLPPKWRRSTKDDTIAARIVIANSISILHLAQKKKRRWHYDDDGLHTTDWSIIEAILRDRLTVRDVAGLLGLDRSGSDITRRFKAALDTISEVVDPQKILIPAKRGVGPNIERRKAGEVSRPIFDACQRAAALAELDRAARKVRPPISHVWPSAKVPRWSGGWFNVEAHNRAPRLFILICKYQSRGWWTTEEELVDDDRRRRMAESGCRAIWSGACDVWQPTNEDPRLLDFVPIYDWGKMRSERTHLIHLVRAPRGYSTSIGSPNFAGPVIEKAGKIYPRAYGSNRITAGGAAADDAWLNGETVTRFERAATRADDEPLFETINA